MESSHAERASELMDKIAPLLEGRSFKEIEIAFEGLKSEILRDWTINPPQN